MQFPSHPSQQSGAKPILTIQPSSGWTDLNLVAVWQFRDLLISLSSRDFRVRYKQTALGVAWIVLLPVITAAIFAFVFGTVAGLPSEGVPYFLFSYAGMLGWSVFSSTLNRVSQCMVSNSQLVSKVYFPRLVLPFSVVPATLLDFCVAVVMLIPFMAWFELIPTWQVLLLPLWLSILVVLAVGVGLFAASLMVRFRDVGLLLPVAIQLMLYASPVSYSVAAVPEHYRIMFQLNPLAAVMEGFRWSILDTRAPEPWALAYSAGSAIVIFVCGLLFFQRLEREFADVI